MRLSVALLLANSALLAAGTPIGVLPLDSITFDKVVGSATILVKFDKKYAYGEHEDEWKATAGEYGPMAGVLLAEVGVTDYGEKENDDLRERFGLANEDFPAFMLFKKGSTEPIKYTGEANQQGLAQFLKEGAGIWIGLSGCLEDFDGRAAKYASASAGERTKLLGEAKEAAASLEGEESKSAKAYIKTMERIAERGEDYPATETARVNKLLQSRLTDAKKKGFKQRINILASFNVKGAGKSEL